MTTNKQYHDVDGTFETSGMSENPCRSCGSDQVKYQEWDSSDGAYTDYKYTCMSCGACWWVDGTDA